MEEGEIFDGTRTSRYGYDASYEWPDNLSGPSDAYSDNLSSNDAPMRHVRRDLPCFRLLVQETSILKPREQLAILDGLSEVQFGRDVPPLGSTTPRIRLKEMEVSKLHATAYWDGARREWGIVDMGSMHGTFLQSPSTSSPIRLSAPRVASLPRRLHHMDLLRIGSTVFLVHSHDGCVPCEQCATSGNDEIPLRTISKSTVLKRKRIDGDVDANNTSKVQNPRKALTALKQSLLSRHEVIPQTDVDSSVLYVDRSARRRALFPAAAHDSPGAQTLQGETYPSQSTPSEPAVSVPIISAPAAPLSTSNIGHQLLLKQGWTPRMALGQTSEDGGRVGLKVPLEINFNAPRAGLGSKPASQTIISTDTTNTQISWKEAGLKKRWEAMVEPEPN